jgi:hypothetical protein
MIDLLYYAYVRAYKRDSLRRCSEVAMYADPHGLRSNRATMLNNHSMNFGTGSRLQSRTALLSLVRSPLHFLVRIQAMLPVMLDNDNHSPGYASSLSLIFRIGRPT